jgi:hypothetical protein
MKNKFSTFIGTLIHTWGRNHLLASSWARGAVVVLLALLVFAGQNAQAAGGTWNADLAGNWSDTTKWNPIAVPGITAGDTVGLTFNITLARAVTIDTAVTLGTLNIGDITTSSSAFTLGLSSGSLTFDQSGNGSGTANLNQVSTSFGDTISAGFSLNDNLTIANASTAKTLTLSGIIANGVNGYKTITISNAANKNSLLSLSGNNTYGPAAGATGTTLSGGACFASGLGQCLWRGRLGYQLRGHEIGNQHQRGNPEQHYS